MQGKFLHKTVRAEWWGVFPTYESGPFASFHEAFEECGATADIEYRESPVEIDPILMDTVGSISDLIEKRIDNILQEKRRNSEYLHVNVVRRQIMKLARNVRENTFKLNQENPNASS